MTTGIQISLLPAAPAVNYTDEVPVVTVGHISNITQAATAVVIINDTTSVNPFTAGQSISITGVGGMTQMNGQSVVISSVGGASGAWTLVLPINSSAFSAYTSGGIVTGTAAMTVQQSLLSAVGSPYNPTFQSGGIQYAGPAGVIASDNNMIFGKNVPNPSGIPGPVLLLGSGGGAGANVSFWIIQDQAFDTASPGNDLNLTAGEVQPGSSQRGGNIFDIAGAADLGTGGQNLKQGGTSARGPGGIAVLQGGNNSDGLHPPGDAFISAGQAGSVGATYHLIATIVNGVPGVGRHRFNSTITIDEYSDGSWFWYGSNGFGVTGVITPTVARGAGQPFGPASPSEVYNGTVPLAKLTTGGTAGAMVIVNGLVTSVTIPT